MVARASFGKFAGIHNTVSAYAIERADLAEAVNVDIDNASNANRRDGYTLRSAGACHSLWAAGELCLMRRSDKLYRVYPDFALLELLSGLGTRRMAYQFHNGRVYMSDGAVTRSYDGQRIRNWGIFPVTQQPSLAAIGGSAPKGVYHVAVVYLRSDGEESGTGIAASIELASQGGIAMTGIQVSADPDVTHKAIYMTRPNGTRLRRAAVITNATTTFEYTSTTVRLGVTLATQFRQPPPAGTVLAEYHGRLLVAVSDSLVFSDPYLPERFDPARRSFRFDGAILVLATTQDAVYVGTDTSIYRLGGGDLAAATLDKVADYGVYPGGVSYVDGVFIGDGTVSGRVALITTKRGVCVATDTGLRNMTQARYRMKAAKTAAAVTVLQDGRDRYLTVLQR